jgi:putative oxidoreductase
MAIASRHTKKSDERRHQIGALTTFGDALIARLRSFAVAARMVGSSHAHGKTQERPVSTHDIAAAVQNTPNTRGSRVTIVALWVTQIALAAMFLLAGGSKLAGAPAMIALFDAIGFGQWFRYVTGAIEVGAAVALLIPSAALFGALLLIPTMMGAVAANLSLGQSPAMPVVLLLAVGVVVWARRRQLSGLLSR